MHACSLHAGTSALYVGSDSSLLDDLRCRELLCSSVGIGVLYDGVYPLDDLVEPLDARSLIYSVLVWSASPAISNGQTHTAAKLPPDGPAMNR